MRRVMFMSLLFGAALAATPVLAEMVAPQPAPSGPPAYGEQINLEQAKKAAAAAAEEARDGERGVGALANRSQDRIRNGVANFPRAVQRLLAFVGDIGHSVIDARFGVSDRRRAALGDIIERGLVILHAIGALFGAFRAAHGIPA